MLLMSVSICINLFTCHLIIYSIMGTRTFPRNFNFLKFCEPCVHVGSGQEALLEAVDVRLLLR